MPQHYSRRSVNKAALILMFAAVLAGSCQNLDRSIDPFPIAMEVRAGAVFVGATDQNGERLPVTVDTLSPLTILDSFTGEGMLPTPKRLALDLRLFSQGSSTAERIRFPNTEIFDIHPCSRDGAPQNCLIGVDGNSTLSRGTIGTNVLGLQAVRFDFVQSELRFFPDIAGTNSERSMLCEAVLAKLFAGSGTLKIADGELDYIGLRPAVGACLDDSDPTASGEVLEERGIDTLLVISTGIGISILAESTYNEFARTFSQPLAADLPEVMMHLPSGPVRARLGHIGHLTLTGDIGDNNEQRGPCGELYANRLIAEELCSDGTIADGECPCPNGENFCRVGASILLKDMIEVAVVDDQHPLLQALRVELRPAFPELGGVLGASALAPTRADFDYPNQRLLLRCLDPSRCQVRPQIVSRADLPAIQKCLP